MESKSANVKQSNKVILLILAVFRYASVAIVTLCSLILFIFSLSNTYANILDLIIFIGFIIYFPVILLTLGFWLYSFVLSIKRKSIANKVLLGVHIVDIILVIGAFLMLNRPGLKCNADIMAQYYEQHSAPMLDLINDMRIYVPDSARMVYELDYDFNNGDQYLNKSQINELQKRLKDIGCIGIELGNSNKGKEWNTIRFRRVKMGMYSFRFYNTPLTDIEMDSININRDLIVFNESTVFEYGGGAFGPQYFLDKDEFMTTHNKQDK